MSRTDHKLNLYYSPGACSLAPHIVLYASGLPFNVTDANVNKPWPPEYEKLNPKKQVPFIELEPGVILTEIPAIMTAISQLAPEKKFLGEPGIEVLRSYEWMNYLSGQLHARRFGVFFRPQRYVNDEKLYPMVKQVALENIHEAFGIVESKMNTLKPVDGSKLWAVDPYLFVFFLWGGRVGIDTKKDFPKYHERMIAVSKLDPVIKATAAEGLDISGLA